MTGLVIGLRLNLVLMSMGELRALGLLGTAPELGDGTGESQWGVVFFFSKQVTPELEITVHKFSFWKESHQLSSLL